MSLNEATILQAVGDNTAGTAAMPAAAGGEEGEGKGGEEDGGEEEEEEEAPDYVAVAQLLHWA